MNCQICDISCTGIENFEQHLASQRHKKKQDLYILNQAFSKSSSSNLGNASSDTVHSTSEESEKGESFNEMYNSFKKENVELFGKAKSIIEADKLSENIPVESKVSMNKNANVELFEKAKSIKEAYKLSGNTPIESNVSMNNVELKQWYCEICNIQCTGIIPYNQHIKSNKHEKGKLRQELNAKFKMPANYIKINDASQMNIRSIPIKENDVSKDINMPDVFMNEIFGRYQILTRDQLNITCFEVDEKIDFDKCQKNGENEKESCKDTPMDVTENLGIKGMITMEETSDEKMCQEIDSKEINKFKNSNKDKRFDVEEEIFHICEVCNVQLINKDDFIQHYNSEKHLKRQLRNSQCATC